MASRGRGFWRGGGGGNRGSWGNSVRKSAPVTVDSVIKDDCIIGEAPEKYEGWKLYFKNEGKKTE
jgi:hypothetical protein